MDNNHAVIAKLVRTKILVRQALLGEKEARKALSSCYGIVRKEEMKGIMVGLDIAISALE